MIIHALKLIGATLPMLVLMLAGATWAGLRTLAVSARDLELTEADFAKAGAEWAKVVRAGARRIPMLTSLVKVP